MPISFTEKRALQKVIATNLETLAAGDLPFSDKRRFQKEIQDAFSKLKAVVDLKPEVQNQKLTDLIAGKYNAEPPEGFLKILKEIIEEINDIEPVKPPTISYIETNQEKVNAIMESALGEVFGKLWDKQRLQENGTIKAA
jgi:hypothetical protein